MTALYLFEFKRQSQGFSRHGGLDDERNEESRRAFSFVFPRGGRSLSQRQDLMVTYTGVITGPRGTESLRFCYLKTFSSFLFFWDLHRKAT